MLLNDCIAKLLDMEPMKIKNVEQNATTILLTAEMDRKPSACPACGNLTDTIHDYRSQRVKDCPIQGKAVFWIYRKRRYRCPHCGKRFYEANSLLPKWHRITNRLVLQSIQHLSFKLSRKDIAALMHVSASTVGRWLQLVECGHPSRLPSVLSIDEFRGNTEFGKFQCILTDPVKKRVLDVLPTYKEGEIFRYLSAFSNCRDVRYFVSDMKKEYISIAKRLFPNATIVIDRFHVVRYCTWALENVRKRIQKDLHPDQRRYFKRSRKLLLSHMESLTPQGMDAVRRMLERSQDLRNAYLLKEKFYLFMDSKDSKEARHRLEEFYFFTELLQIPEFQPCLTMLRNWQDYILNAFDCPYSNGFTEGCNNSIKVLKRIAYGYRSFRNFRCRILLTLNNKEPFSS